MSKYQQIIVLVFNTFKSLVNVHQDEIEIIRFIMVDQYISAQHIEKLGKSVCFIHNLKQQKFVLGHKIQEIRERALFNIVSKLDNGVLFDNGFARSKDLLKYLCKWFLFEPCSQEEVVFSLLKRILKVFILNSY